MTPPDTPSQDHPHAGHRLLMAGSDLADADIALIMMHGRGAGPADILGVAREVPQEGVAFLAPEAAGWSWYPQGFMAPRPANEPFVTSALRLMADLVAHLETEGIDKRRIILMGFSQGACLSLELAARQPDRFGGIVAYSGGLIGQDLDADYPGDLQGTPVFLGCSDRDPHIPLPRVQESTRVMERLGGEVTERIYPGMPHTINREEISWLRALLEDLAAAR